ncbi:DUF488 family protein [Sphingomonas rustica]|uniref:DUF488 domain-containing protein n=1 Tax=Sphingomonas rustica TaxID=3103142 RepID=UPI0031FDB190
MFTIGHSTRSIEEFVTLLRAGRVELVVDIRTVPRSRTNPQYNLDVLADALLPFQIAHCRIAELGGLRKKSDVPPDVNGLWRNKSFHNYADYALSQPFRDGLAILNQLASERRTAMMCAEALWWRCHRRIVADYLMGEGKEVFHLMGEDTVSRAKLTEGAIVSGHQILYPTSAVSA